MRIPDRNVAYEKALELLHACVTRYGFIAAKETTANGNYTRIWGRDSMICSIAALMSKDERLIKAVKASLETLMRFQHRQGEIPSNVDPKGKKVSFGGTAGRVDATLWFLVGFGQYVRRTGDIAFARKYYEHFRKAITLMRVHEFNHKGLIYIPLSGDWADEYIQEGYILYDQALYYQAFREYGYLKRKLRKAPRGIPQKAQRIKKTIRANYWLDVANLNSKHIYNAVLYKKALRKHKKRQWYLLPYFNPSGYGFRFDLFGNALAMLTDVATDQQKRDIYTFVAKKFGKDGNIPVFDPVITPQDEKWQHLKDNYSVKFRNKPYEYHNGGIWPMVQGFFVAAIHDRQKAGDFLDKLNALNAQKGWEFNENFHAKTLNPKGTKHQAWSAAGTLIAHLALKGKKVFV